MASNNEYKLTIELTSTGQEAQSGTTTPTASNGGGEQKSAKKEQNNGVKQTVAVYHFAKNLATKYLSHQINTITLRTGFEEQQAQIQLAYNLGMRAFNIGESALMGAIMTGGNPAGVLAGVAVGLVTEALDMGLTAREVGIARDVEATQLYLNTIRMGAGANRGGGR